MQTKEKGKRGKTQHESKGNSTTETPMNKCVCMGEFTSICQRKGTWKRGKIGWFPEEDYILYSVMYYT